MNATRRLLWLSTVTIVLGGCAAGVTRQAAEGGKLAPAPAAATRIVLSLSAKPSLPAGGDWLAFRDEWQTSMSAATAAAGIGFKFAAAEDAMPAEPATLVKLIVNDFRYVSQSTRYAVGIFAGNAFMDVEAQFVEAPSGRVLGTRKYATSSSAWQGVFSAMTPKQVEAVAQEIVKEVTAR